MRWPEEGENGEGERGWRGATQAARLDGGVGDAEASAGGGDGGLHGVAVGPPLERHVRRQQRDAGLEAPDVEVGHPAHTLHLPHRGPPHACLTPEGGSRVVGRHVLDVLSKALLAEGLRTALPPRQHACTSAVAGADASYTSGSTETGTDPISTFVLTTGGHHPPPDPPPTPFSREQ